MAKYIIAHDFGTTGNKATLYNENGKLLESTFFGYGTYYPRVNWAEQDPHDWWKAVCESTKELISEININKDEIAVISFSAQMMGCLPLDRNGNPLRNSIIWADQRSVEQAEVLRNKLGGKKIYNITGHRISPTYSGEKIMWVKDNEPDIYEKTYKFVHAKDYIVYKLTGEYVTDYSDASGMNFYDVNKMEWSEEILEVAKIDREKLPTPHCSFDVIGEVQSSVAKQIGLKPGTPVVIGSGDGIAASVGAGVVSEGKAYNYIGSSSWVALATSEPIMDPERRTFNYIHADPEMYMPCGTMQSAGGSYNWIKENICRIEEKSAEDLDMSPFQLMDMLIEESEPAARNLIFLPYLMGERSPYWNPDARGAFIGLTRQHERSDIVRAVLEGITFNLKMIDEILEEFVEYDQIRVIGGGASGLVWRKIMADIYNKEILMPEILKEATSLGAAVLGGVGVGIFDSLKVAPRLNPVVDIQKPVQKKVIKYEKLFPIFKEAYSSLENVYDNLADLN